MGKEDAWCMFVCGVLGGWNKLAPLRTLSSSPTEMPVHSRASGFSYHPAGCPAGCPTGDIAKSFSAVWASATLIASIVARSRFPLFNTNRLHLYHEIRRPISSTPATPQEAGQAGPSAIISCACPQPLTWRKPAWHEMRTRAGDVSSGERDGSRMESRLKDRRRPVPFSGHPLAVTSPLGSQSPSGAVVC